MLQRFSDLDDGRMYLLLPAVFVLSRRVLGRDVCPIASPLRRPVSICSFFGEGFTSTGPIDAKSAAAAAATAAHRAPNFVTNQSGAPPSGTNK
jgi:hypothetical protein